MFGVSIIVLEHSVGHYLELPLVANDLQQCDGIRPECFRCHKASVPCVYLSDDAEATPTMALKNEVDTLQRRLQEHTNFLNTIRNAPEEEALSLVRQLRSAENASAVLSSYKAPVGTLSHTSPYASARAVKPSTESSIGFKMTTHHPTTYLQLVSPSPSVIASGSLMRGSTQTTSSSNTSLSVSDRHINCDSRLEHLTVRYWTQTPIDDGLAARAISYFLHTDHPLLGFFDTDLFLRDLVEQSPDFCSSFLFSSVMSLACVCSNIANSREAF